LVRLSFRRPPVLCQKSVEINLRKEKKKEEEKKNSVRLHEGLSTSKAISFGALEPLAAGFLLGLDDCSSLLLLPFALSGVGSSGMLGACLFLRPDMRRGRGREKKAATPGGLHTLT
jgi:hypothetical protein